MMKIIPAVDLLEGKVVRLHQGNYNQVTLFHDDPIALISSWVENGVDELHLVDLSGARDPQHAQIELLESICRINGLSVQTGGGIRNQGDVERRFSMGFSRLVIGSLAVTEPEALEDFCQIYGGEHFVVAADAWVDQQGRSSIRTHGWQEESTLSVEALATRAEAWGISRVLATDISKDGTGTGPNHAWYRSLAEQFPKIDWIASGGVHAQSDFETLSQTGVAAVVVGRALLSGDIQLSKLR